MMKIKSKTRAILLAIGLIAISACGENAAVPSGAVGLPSGAEGIDLSHHNGRVDWEALGQYSPDFIYLKATEGTDWKDTRFQDNWQNALGEGYRVGAYHFYLLCKPGAEQAANFIQSVEVRTDTLLPAVDLEYAENCEAGENWLEELAVFIEAVEVEYAKPVLIYTTPEFLAKELPPELVEWHPLWLRSLTGPPTPPDGRLVDIWQYAMDGQVAGIEGPVDLNRVP